MFCFWKMYCGIKANAYLYSLRLWLSLRANTVIALSVTQNTQGSVSNVDIADLEREAFEDSMGRDRHHTFLFLTDLMHHDICNSENRVGGNRVMKFLRKK